MLKHDYSPGHHSPGVTWVLVPGHIFIFFILCFVGSWFFLVEKKMYTHDDDEI